MDVPDEDMTETLIALTSDITAAHVGNNQVPLEQVPTLIENIYNALAGLGRTDEDQNAPRKPAVSIRSSVRPGYVVCLECGRKMSMLKRHLATEHGLSPEEYRTRWNLRPDHLLVAPNYAKRRSELATKIGLGRISGQKRGRRRKS